MRTIERLAASAVQHTGHVAVRAEPVVKAAGIGAKGSANAAESATEAEKDSAPGRMVLLA
jgi:hypothetical protein